MLRELERWCVNALQKIVTDQSRLGKRVSSRMVKALGASVGLDCLNAVAWGHIHHDENHRDKR